MILRTGVGSLRTRVGMARIWSPARQGGVLDQVNDLDVVFAGQVVLADALEVGKGGNGFRGLTGDVEPKLPELGVGFGFGGHWGLSFERAIAGGIGGGSGGGGVVGEALAGHGAAVAQGRGVLPFLVFDALVELFQFGLEGVSEDGDLAVGDAGACGQWRDGGGRSVGGGPGFRRPRALPGPGAPRRSGRCRGRHRRRSARCRCRRGGIRGSGWSGPCRAI